jgi:hypothetical protein
MFQNFLRTYVAFCKSQLAVPKKSFEDFFHPNHGQTEANCNLPIADRGRIFSHVHPSLEQAVSDLDP